MDAFLLFCAAEESPFFPNGGFCQDSHNNFGPVAKEGRTPGLTLINQNKAVALSDWGNELIDRILPYAELPDSTLDAPSYVKRVTDWQTVGSGTGVSVRLTI